MRGKISERYSNEWPDFLEEEIENPFSEKEADFYDIVFGSIIIKNNTCYELLKHVLEPVGQIQPVMRGNDVLLVAKINNLVDCLDINKSNNKMDEIVAGSCSFFPDLLPKESIFRIPQEKESIFCHQGIVSKANDFKYIIENNHLKGFKFEKVWTNLAKSKTMKNKNLWSEYNKSDLKSRFNEYEIGSAWKKIEPYLKPSIHLKFQPTDESGIPLGSSKAGGYPDMPETIEWPMENSGRPLAFISQINCREIKPFDINNELPNTGILLFFYSYSEETWGAEPSNSDTFKIIYIDDNCESSLVRREFPDTMSNKGKFKSCKITFENEISYQNYISYREDQFVETIFDADELVCYGNIDDDIFQERGLTMSKMLGWPNSMQNGDMPIDCVFPTNGISYSERQQLSEEKLNELKKQRDEWVFLLQIDSEHAADMMWQDGGKIYYWIKKEDLKKRNFDNCWVLIESC
jgi:uncharacterized protein YwqG